MHDPREETGEQGHEGPSGERSVDACHAEQATGYSARVLAGTGRRGPHARAHTRATADKRPTNDVHAPVNPRTATPPAATRRTALISRTASRKPECVQSPTDPDLRALFTETRTIAVLGANVDPNKPAFFVPEYLSTQGFEIHPINPSFAGRTLWGRPFLASLTELEEPVDMVDIFRRPEALMAHVPEILGMRTLPKVVWLQLGIAHAEFARQLTAAGIRVVQDHCTLAEHRRLSR